VAAGRGWYTGSIHAHDGTLAASLTQEVLFRTPRRRA
jgi:acyl-CoA thioesterase-2